MTTAVTRRAAVMSDLKRSAKMKLIFQILISVLCLALGGCVYGDFKAVDSLNVGVARENARKNIESYGFTKFEKEYFRPAGGWPDGGKGFFDVEWRAGAAEKKIRKTIFSSEAYPVSHGFLGYGWIYLFYAEDGTLLHYYRLQIN